MVSAFDHGYMYGIGLFETFRVDNGHPFLLDDHFQRLKASLKEVGIEWSMSKEEVLAVLHKLLDANQLRDAYVRWNVSAGIHDLGLYSGGYTEPTTIVYMKPLPKGMLLKKDAVVLQMNRNSPEGSFRFKSHHFLNNVLAKRELGEATNVEGVFLTEAGFVAEGIVSNVFWVKDGIVYTPDINTGILDGVTRNFVLALLHKKAIPYQIGYYSKDELLNADEAFVTNSIQEIVTLQSINGHSYKGSSLAAKLKRDFDFYKREQLWSRSEVMEEDYE